ncbi:MAG: hypothetical protein FD152_1728 [Xanthobacteraceae bacterium]|nr:MAG: hypothetical protein FD152_1728 [Xanthobacteraceae bacterium]
MLSRTPETVACTASASSSTDAVTVLTAMPAVVAAVGAELRDFAAERLRANGERIRAWSKVRSPLEFADAELRFAVETMGIYADEAMHLQDIARAAFEIAAPAAKS